MAQQTPVVTGQQPAQSRHEVPGHARDWRINGLLAGFVATVLMSGVVALAYLVARNLGVETGNTFQRWLYELAHNPLISRTGDRIILAIAINLAIGLVFGLIYARYAEPRLSGPGWLKGMTFSLLPWFLSIIAFFPAAGLGIFASDIDAGPLPIIGNLIAHLVYGGTLGAVYAIRDEDWLDESEEDWTASMAAERGAVGGLLVGLVVGVLVGLGISPVLDDVAGQTVIVLASALTLGGVGLLIGSLMAIGDGPSHDSPSR